MPHSYFLQKKCHKSCIIYCKKKDNHVEFREGKSEHFCSCGNGALYHGVVWAVIDFHKLGEAVVNKAISSTVGRGSKDEIRKNAATHRKVAA